MSWNTPAVPMAKAQLGLTSLRNTTQQPGTGEIIQRKCIILLVYDLGTIQDGTAPPDILGKAEIFPNVTYAQVQLDDGRRMTLPFKESASQLHSTYGNSLILEGSYANIEFYNARIRTGVIVPQDDPLQIPADMIVATTVYDIGMLV